MPTPASIKGHPIHGILVALPVGLLLFSLVSDVRLRSGLGRPRVGGRGPLYAGRRHRDRDPRRHPRHRRLPDLSGRARRIATYHLLLNLTVISVFSMDFPLRLRADPYDRVPVVFSAIGIVLLSRAGWGA